MSFSVIRHVGVLVVKVGYNNLPVVARLEGYEDDDTLYLVIKQGKKVIVDMDGKEQSEAELKVRFEEAKDYAKGFETILGMRD
jgi:hypothetical protein